MKKLISIFLVFIMSTNIVFADMTGEEKRARKINLAPFSDLKASKMKVVTIKVATDRKEINEINILKDKMEVLFSELYQNNILLKYQIIESKQYWDRLPEHNTVQYLDHNIDLLVYIDKRGKLHGVDNADELFDTYGPAKEFIGEYNENMDYYNIKTLYESGRYTAAIYDDRGRENLSLSSIREKEVSIERLYDYFTELNPTAQFMKGTSKSRVYRGKQYIENNTAIYKDHELRGSSIRVRNVKSAYGLYREHSGWIYIIEDLNSKFKVYDSRELWDAYNNGREPNGVPIDIPGRIHDNFLDWYTLYSYQKDTNKILKYDIYPSSYGRQVLVEEISNVYDVSAYDYYLYKNSNRNGGVLRYITKEHDGFHVKYGGLIETLKKDYLIEWNEADYIYNNNFRYNSVDGKIYGGREFNELIPDVLIRPEREVFRVPLEDIKFEGDENEYIILDNMNQNENFGFPYLTNDMKDEWSGADIYSNTNNPNFKLEGVTSELTIGQFVDSYSNISVSIDQTIEKIKTKVLRENETPKKVLYATTEDEIYYQKSNTDYENNPVLDERFKYDFEGIYNTSQSFSLDGEFLENPIQKFGSTGKYTVTYQAQDDGSDVFTMLNGNKPDKNMFGEYNLWSSNKEQMEIYIHTKPIALFGYTISGNRITFTDTSYDPDHTDRADKGLVEKEWSYKYKGESWHSGIPTFIDTTKIMSIKLRVKDIEGAWSAPLILKTDQSENIPPVALFSLENTMYLGETNEISDSSYDVDGSISSWKWEIYSGSSKIYSNGNRTSTQNKLKYLSVGDYKITLTVTDNRGAISLPYTQTLRVINKQVKVNKKPKAELAIKKGIMLVNDSNELSTNLYDPDGDKIEALKWAYRKTGAWSYKTLNKDVTPYQFNSFELGEYEFKVQAKDDKDLWGDWSNTVKLKIIPRNTKPSAAFTINQKVLEGNPLDVIDLSNSNDSWDKIVEHKWIIEDSSGRQREITAPPTLAEEVEIEKNYRFFHRVKDNGNELSPGLWSDYYTKMIRIFPRNTKPIFSFTIENSIFKGEEILYNIFENANDSWDTIVEHQWKLSLDGGNTFTEVRDKPTRLLNIGEVIIQGRAKDRGNELSEGLWSDWAEAKITVLEKPNNPPIAEFEVSPNPQLEGNNVNYDIKDRDPDLGDYITANEWRVYNLDTAEWSSIKSTPTSSFSAGNYIIAHRVKDHGNTQYSALWSEYCYRPLTIIERNTKPIVTFVNNPQNGVINEAVVFTPTADPMDVWDQIVQFEWSYRIKGVGSYNVFSTQEIPAFIFTEKGTYEVRCRVKDRGNILSPGLWSDYYKRELIITELKVTGDVFHTEKWNQNRVNYNMAKSGNPNEPRGIDIYFPGERFVIKAKTTGTADSVTVEIEGTPYITHLTQSQPNIWTGELWHPDMLEWDDRDVRFIFRARNSSVEKTYTVTKFIVDDEYYKMHREF